MAAEGKTSKRGFAAMAPEKAREVHRLGGQTAQRLGKSQKLSQNSFRSGK